MTIRIVYQRAGGTREEIELLDLEHQHELTATPTDNPVEDGSVVSDHIKDDLDVFTAKVFVSNSMLRAEGTQMDGAVETTTSIDLSSGGKMQVLGLSQKVDRVKLVYEALLALKSMRVVCTIFTPLRSYDTMVLTSVTIPVNGTDGAEITIRAREVRIVATETSSTPVPRQVRARPQTNAGTQSTQPAPPTAPPQPPRRSALLAFTQGIGIFD